MNTTIFDVPNVYNEFEDISNSLTTINNSSRANDRIVMKKVKRFGNLIVGYFRIILGSTASTNDLSASNAFATGLPAPVHMESSPTNGIFGVNLMAQNGQSCAGYVNVSSTTGLALIRTGSSSSKITAGSWIMASFCYIAND